MIEYVSDIKTTRYFTVAAAALVLYDYAITMRQEIDTVWRRRVSVISILLMLTRWSLLVTATLMLVPPSPTTCTSLQTASGAVELIGLATVAILAALRVCAIWHQNWYLFFVVLVPGITPTPIVAFLMAQARDRGYAPEPFDSCTLTFTTTALHVYPILAPVTAICCIIMQMLTVSLTWAKTYRHWQRARKLRVPLVLTTCLLRDGTVYFITFLAISVLQIIIYVKNIPHISIIVNVMPPMLVNRFLFNLRQLVQRRDAPSYNEPAIVFSLPNYLSTIDVFGNIGESVDVADKREEDDAHHMDPLEDVAAESP